MSHEVSVDEFMSSYHKGRRDFRGIRMVPKAVFGSIQLQDVDLSGAQIEAALFGEADLTRVDLSDAKLVGLECWDLSLSSCRLTRADLRHSEIWASGWERSDLSDANLSHSVLRDAGFSDCRLRGARLDGTIFVNVDARPFCLEPESLLYGGRCSFDYLTVLRTVGSPGLKEFMLRAGVPPMFVEYMVTCAEAMDPKMVRRLMRSTFISHGGPDEAFAKRLSDALYESGVKTFVFSSHAVPGERLHRVMRKGVNEYDRVILVCSEASLNRPGVLNEIEETLAREARDGGGSYLIPVRLDDYVFTRWAPARPDLAGAIRDRVVADFVGASLDQGKFREGVRRLLDALRRTESDGPEHHMKV